MKDDKKTAQGGTPNTQHDGNVLAEPALMKRPDRSNDTDARAKRPKRIPIGTRKVLQYPEREGFHRRVVNDTYGRIKMFEDAGYEVVRDQNVSGEDPRAGAASQMGSAVGKPVGGGIQGVLMEIPKEWYDEDQEAKQKRIDSLEADMMRKPKADDTTYGEIKIGSTED